VAADLRKRISEDSRRRFCERNFLGQQYPKLGNSTRAEPAPSDLKNGELALKSNVAIVTTKRSFWAIAFIGALMNSAQFSRAGVIGVVASDARTGFQFNSGRTVIPDNTPTADTLAADGYAASYVVEPRVIDEDFFHFAGVALPTELHLTLSGADFVGNEYALADFRGSVKNGFFIPNVIGSTFVSIHAKIEVHVPEGFKADVGVSGAALVGPTNSYGDSRSWSFQDPGDYFLQFDYGPVLIDYPHGTSVQELFTFSFYIEGRQAGDAYIRFTDPGTELETIAPSAAAPEPGSIVIWFIGAMVASMAGRSRFDRRSRR